MWRSNQKINIFQSAERVICKICNRFNLLMYHTHKVEYLMEAEILVKLIGIRSKNQRWSDVRPETWSEMDGDWCKLFRECPSFRLIYLP